MNDRLADARLPVRVANLSSIWTLCYTEPGRYNWMFQYYLRAEGIALSWVGTGRLIFSLNYTDADFDEVVERVVRAGMRMREDGWWWHDGRLTNKAIKRAVLLDILGALAPRWLRTAPPPAAATPTLSRADDPATGPSGGPAAGGAARGSTA
jgi:hypothetical protein